MPDDTYSWFEEGYAEGQYAATTNLESTAGRAELFEAYEEDRLGEIAGDSGYLESRSDSESLRALR